MVSIDKVKMMNKLQRKIREIITEKHSTDVNKDTCIFFRNIDFENLDFSGTKRPARVLTFMQRVAQITKYL